MFMKLVEKFILNLVKPSQFRQAEWKKAFAMARCDAEQMGGLYTASLYVNLFSLLRQDPTKVNLALFAYGSGSTATLMHATVHPDRAKVPTLNLDQRSMVSFGCLQGVLKKECDILERNDGVYYREVSDNAIVRTYGKF